MRVRRERYEEAGTAFERVDWPSPEVIANAQTPARQPLAIDKVGDAARQALAHLIASQRDDGSWHAPAEDFGYSSDLCTAAISALCATSLVDETGNSKARRAVERTREHGGDLGGGGLTSERRS